MVKFLRTAYFLVIFILGITSGYSQVESYDIDFRTYSIDQGLSNFNTHDIEQDTNGFLWIATSDGLNRFDGYSFKIFKPSLSAASVPDNNVNDLFVDSRGTLWLATNTNALVRYNDETESFATIEELLYDTINFNENRILRIAEDSKGNLWICYDHMGIVKYNPSSGSSMVYSHDPNNENSLSSNVVVEVAVDNEDNVWVGTADRGLNIINQDNDQVKRYSALPSDKSGLRGTYIEFIGVENNTVRVSTDKGIFNFDTADSTFTQISHLQIFDIKTIKNGKTYCASVTGLYELFDNKLIKVYRHDNEEPGSIANNDIRAIMEDRSGTVWLCSNNGGIISFYPFQKAFKTFQSASSDPASLSADMIRSFSEDKWGNIWVATLQEGIDVYNSESGEHVNLVSDSYKGIQFINNSITEIFRDSRNNMWIGTWGQGVFLLKDGQTQVLNLMDILEDHGGIVDNIVLSVFEDSYGNIWIGTERGVDIYNPDLNQLRHYYVSDKYSSYNAAYSVQSKCIIEDQYHNFWVGTYGGLHHFYSDNGKSNPFYDTYKHQYFHGTLANPDSLQDERVIALHYAPEINSNMIFIGTYSEGLSIAHLNENNGELKNFERISMDNGLPNNVIYTIQNDEKNNLWLSTNLGLCKYNILNKSVENYFEHDGLQGNQFFWGSAFKSSNGELFFGGLNGYTRFFPDSINKGSYIPPVVITNLLVNNKVVEVKLKDKKKNILHKSIVYEKGIELSHKEDVISLEFSALNFAYPEFNNFEYKLEGVDNEYIKVDALHRLVSYTHLNPGRYTFRLRASNHEGLWNPTEKTLKITISPPFWETVWFRTLILFIFIIGVVRFIRYRISYVEKQKKVLERKVSENTSELKEKYELLEKQTKQLDESNSLLIQLADEMTHANLELTDHQKKITEQSEELQVQTEVLELKNAELHQSNVTKDKFFNIIAHDLMNPLNSILGLSELLANRFDKLEKKKIRAYINGILQSSLSLHDLLTNLLQWARAQAKRIKVEPEQINLDSIIDANIKLHQEATLKKKIEVKNLIDNDLKVFVDHQTFNTVIRNVISNAIKFTPENGEISISSTMSEIGVDVIIVDSGVGIGKENIKRLFQIESNESTKGTEGETGTGLGLVLCKEFISLNNGKIKIESEEGKGTKVILSVPDC